MPGGDRNAVGAVTRLVAAVSLFALEMQLATWLSVGAIRSLFLVNVAILIVSIATERVSPPGVARLASSGRRFQSDLALLVPLAMLVLALNVLLPLQAADPYHLDRVAQIGRLGTLGYDPFNPDPKVNVLGWTYELLLADIAEIPVIGRALLQMHGVLGMALYALAVAAARHWVRGGRLWSRAAAFTVPVVFHQFVLVKNDLFGAIPALVVLAWLVARAPRASLGEIAWASWLTGFAVAVKVTSAPLAVVFVATLLVDRPERLRTLGAMLAGGVAGAIGGGLAFTLIENARWYGDPVAVREAGGVYNRNGTAGEMAVGVVRFGLSLFDLGLTTRRIWPGRGGWGSTFGLPMIWALVVLTLHWRTTEAQRALSIAAGYFLLFAAVYTDADIAHRLALAPGVLLILVAISLSEGEDAASRRLRLGLAAVMTLSALQILRSAVLYLSMT